MNATATPAEWLRESAFVFRGTVERLDASTMGFPIEGRTAVVHVDRVLKLPAELGDPTGTSITVVLQAPGSPDVGETNVFFTNGWLYGDSIAVVEVGRLPLDPVSAQMDAESLDALQLNIEAEQDRPLAERVQGAELAAIGRVVGLAPSTQARMRRFASEHDPQWWEATIEVEGALKGAPAETVTLVFPASEDVAWYAAPKPKVGEHSVWLLRKGEHPAAPPDAYTALHPLDVLPKEHMVIDRIRTLVDTPGSSSS